MEVARQPLSEIRQRSLDLKSFPFRHLHCSLFFTSEFYEALCRMFEGIKTADPGGAESEMQRFPGYDAYSWVLRPDVPYPLGFFYRPEWRDLFQDLFGIPLTNDVVAQFHHHAVGSEDGFVHNDYNLSCFVDEPIATGINPWHYQCHYDPKCNDLTDGKVFARMRSITIIYYLGNEEWSEGDGGETGLFLGLVEREPAVAIPPRNNSLLAFEASPESYHAFRSNRVSERNSLIMWFHSEVEAKLERHGREPPVPYAADEVPVDPRLPVDPRPAGIRRR